MNIDYLEKLLEEVKTSITESPQKGNELKVKVAEAFRYLFPSDPNSAIKIESLEFTSWSNSMQAVSWSLDWHSSITILKSTLEAKILILKDIEEKKLQKIDSDKGISRDTDNLIITRLKTINLEQKNTISQNTILINSLNATLLEKSDLNIVLEEKVKQSKRVWNLYSIAFWSLILAAFMGIGYWVYDLGKDNGVKKYDIEKKALDDSNIELRNIIVDKDKTVDSLKKLIP